jgi:hypothetical protein
MLFNQRDVIFKLLVADKRIILAPSFAVICPFAAALRHGAVSAKFHVLFLKGAGLNRACGPKPAGSLTALAPAGRCALKAWTQPTRQAADS